MSQIHKAGQLKTSVPNVILLAAIALSGDTVKQTRNKEISVF